MAALTADAPSSFLKIVLQAAFFEADSCGTGAGSQSIRGRNVFHLKPAPESRFQP
jgi:hypothetical protein